MTAIPYHPLANIFPLLEGSDFQRLVDDVRANGLRFPIIVYDGQILDGRNRHRACEAADKPVRFEPFTGADPVAYVVSANLARRHLNESQRAMVAAKLANMPAHRPPDISPSIEGLFGSLEPPAPPRVSQDQAAAMLNVGRASVERATVVQAKAIPELARKVEAGEVSVSAAADVAKLPEPEQAEVVAKGEKEILQAARRIRAEKSEAGKRERAEKITAAAVNIPAASERFQLYHGPLTDLLNKAPATVDIICTDPPYPREFLSVFGDLARVATHILKPGGLLLCMSGQSWLPEVLKELGDDLTYQWTLAYLTPGGQATQIFPRKVNTFWKPVFVFSNGAYEGDWYGDVTKSDPNDNDKNHHHWGQSESGMYDLMKRFVRPGMTVVDPFLGGGTTAVVALALGATFIGCDVDSNAIDTTKVRLADANLVA
jgi:DNA methylase